MASRVAYGGASRLTPASRAGQSAVDRRNLILIAVVACAVRAFLLAAFSPVQANDSASYLDLAHRIAGGQLSGSPGVRTPGYPILLLLVGSSPRGIWWLQSILGVLAALLLYRLARRLGARPALALAGGLFYALNFEVLALEHTVLTESVASFFVLLAASLAVEVLHAERRRTALVAGFGVVLGAMCLVRPDTAALAAYLAVAVAALVAVRERSSWTGFLRMAALALVIPVVALAGWAAVNRATIGVTTVSTVLGHNMLDHVAPHVSVKPGPDAGIERAYVAARARRQAQGSDLSNLSADAMPDMERAAHLNYAHLSGRLLAIALGVIASHPVQFLGSSIKQWPRFFLPPNYADTFTGGTGASLIHALWKIERGLYLLIEVGFFLLCAADIVWRLRRRPGVLGPPSWLLIGLVPVGLLMATFLAFGETGRYGFVYVTVILAVFCAGAEPLAIRCREIATRGRHPQVSGV